jgi:adenosylcobinamide kinase/adenosylcobinamide-phosphate guanylyltransferase
MSRAASPFVFVSGGCRSGKSAYAQSLAEGYAGRGPALFLATAHPGDEEMRARVAGHQSARGPLWRTREPSPGGEGGLWRELPDLARGAGAVLLDSLTLWLSAAMDNLRQAEALNESRSRLLLALRGLSCPVVLVSDEVGLGLIPAEPAGRFFRDALGLANQQAASLATQAVFIVSGLPILLKGERLP